MSFNAVEMTPGDRIIVEERTHHIYQRLISGALKNPVETPFFLLKDVFLWAVLLGVREGVRTPIEGRREGIFWFYQLSRETDLQVLKTVAVVETGNPGIIVHEDEVMHIAQEYANTGIRILEAELIESSGQPLWNLVRLAREA